MTYEEALNVLDNKIQIDVKYTTDFNRDYECLMKCREALEKQIPRKPIALLKASENDYYDCPTCREFLFAPYRPNCCHHCGQTIDWSDTE